MLKVENLYVSKNSIKDRIKRRDNPIIKGISFTLEPGNIYGLIGHNGAGKTTLLGAMYDLNDYKGRITINGTDLKKTRNRIGFLSAYAISLGSIESGMSLIEEATHFNTKTTNECFEIAPNFSNSEYNRLLKKFSLDELVSPKSRGERKLAKIAHVLSFDKDIYILDEPLAGLDHKSKKNVLEEIRNKALDNKIVIISSHELDDINKSIDSAIFIKKGKLVRIANLDEIRENEGLDLKEAYIKEYGGNIK